jgi:RNA polymerase sigma factor (sigma-70 family)
MEKNEYLKLLFQQEFSKMVAVISNLFGLQHIEIAEDIVSETFLQATETWEAKGIPPNPPAWLYAVAKQKTLYHFRRNNILEKKVIPRVIAGHEKYQEPAMPDFSQQNIKDSLLRMIFAICAPAIASEAQIGLALRILCGFSIDEIAEAFLSNKETINKRLFRAKEKLRQEKIQMEMPAEKEIPARLGNVLHIIYLLFNEGYYSATQNRVLRRDFCYEALRLGIMLAEYKKTNLPLTNALVALMCFHASRFDARENIDGNMILYEEQDAGLWNAGLIKQGMHFLEISMQGNEISSYHAEAQIAYWHCIKDTAGKWDNILSLYDQLLQVNYSPAVALNRTFALYKAKGTQEAIREAEKLKLDNNHFYFLLLGELFSSVDKNKSISFYEKALVLARTDAEKQIIRKKIDTLNQGA